MLSSWSRVCSQAALSRSAVARAHASLEHTAAPLLPSASSASASFSSLVVGALARSNKAVPSHSKAGWGFDGEINSVCLGGTAATRAALSASWARRSFAAGDFHGTTILCVRKDDEVVLIGDGQVTAGHEILKHNVKKVRRIGDSGAIGGFAGSTADALTLFERLEAKLEEYPGQLRRAAVELAKAWRTEKYLRRLDAVMIVADKDCMLQITGNGDVIEPEHGVTATGSGGSYAFAAARALLDVDGLSAMEIAQKSMKIAADICIYTNGNFTVQCLPDESEEGEKPDGSDSDSKDDKKD